MLVGQWSKFLVQIAGTAILARILSPGDFGLVAMVTAIVGLASILSDFGLSLATLRDPNITSQNRSNLFWTNMLIGALASIAVAFAARPISQFYGQPELEGITLALSSIFVLQAAAGQFKAEISRSLRFAKLLWVDISAQLLATMVAITAAYLGASYWSLVTQQIILAGAQLCGLTLLAGWKPQLPRNIAKTSKHFLFGTKASGTQFINYISSNIDTVALGSAWGPSTVGVYNQAYLFFKMPVQQLAAPLTNVIIPILSRLNEKQFAQYTAKLQALLIYVLVGMFTALASVSTPMMLIVLGPGWESVAPIIKILAVGGVFQAMGYLYYWVFVVKNCTGRQMIFGGIARTCMVGLIITLAPWGSNGVAWAVSAGLALNWLLLTVFVVPYTGLSRSHFLSNAIRPITMLVSGFVLISIIEHLLPVSLNAIELLIWLLAGWVIYLVLAFLIVTPLRNDLKNFRDILITIRKTAPMPV